MFKPVRILLCKIMVILSAHAESTLNRDRNRIYFSYHWAKNKQRLPETDQMKTIRVSLIKSQTKNLPFQDTVSFIDHHCFYYELIRWTFKKIHALLAGQESLWMREYNIVFCVLQLRKIGVADFEIKITWIGLIPFNIKSCCGQCSLWDSSDLIFNQSIQWRNNNENWLNLRRTSWPSDYLVAILK